MSLTQYYGTGRRKSSSARVFIRQPDGRRPSGIFVNNIPLDKYFVRDSLKLIIRQPPSLLSFQIITTSTLLLKVEAFLVRRELFDWELPEPWSNMMLSLGLL